MSSCSGDSDEDSWMWFHIEIVGNGSLYCHGSSSCSTARIFVKNNIDHMSNPNNIYCSGRSSCHHSGVNDNGYNGQPYDHVAFRSNVNVYCLGESSCWKTSVKYVTNVYGYSYQSIYESTIEYANSSVYCVAFRSCEKSRM